jgi:hypothetical protein
MPDNYYISWSAAVGVGASEVTLSDESDTGVTVTGDVAGTAITITATLYEIVDDVHSPVGEIADTFELTVTTPA